MRKLSIAAMAASLTLGLGSTAQAVTYTGTLQATFSEYLPIYPFDFDPRPLRFTFVADMTQVSYAYLTFSSDLYFEGTTQVGPPDEPREWFGDLIPLAEDYSSILTPTGFEITINTPDNETCDPYKGPTYYCEHTYPTGFYLDGETLGQTVAYTYSITPIPEPAAWALMIAGFGLAGAGVRRSRAQRLEKCQLPLAS